MDYRVFQGRVSLLCVGNELNGDDAFGRHLADTLEEDGEMQVLFASTAPENFVGEVIDFKPERVVVVDAGDFGGRPGEIRRLQQDELQSVHVSTHRMPMKVLARQFKEEGVDTAFVAVQARHFTPGEEMSEELEAALDELAGNILSVRA